MHSDRDIDLTFVVVNYKADEDTAECVQSLARFAWNLASEFIVVDNTPGTVTDWNTEAPVLLRRIVPNKNLGYGRACNVGLAAARGKYVVFLNPDVAYQCGSARDLVHWMDEHPDVGAAGPMIVHPNGNRQFSCRTFPQLATALYGSSAVLTRFFPGNPWTRKYLRADLNGRVAEVDWISGCCMVARREAIAEIGGFDPRFFLFFEDVDLCRRLKLAGWKRVYYPELRLVHEIGASREHLRGRGRSYHYLSATRYFRKCALAGLARILGIAAGESRSTPASMRQNAEPAWKP